MYKYCIVPKCTNTTIKTPEKLFFNVPKDLKLRKKWYATVKRDDKIPPSARTARYCCEDHFDVENDMENYIKYKLVGGRIHLKKGIVPHKFECQQEKEDEPIRSGVQKRKRLKYFEKILNKDEPLAVLEKPVRNEDTVLNNDEDMTDNENNPGKESQPEDTALNSDEDMTDNESDPGKESQPDDLDNYQCNICQASVEGFLYTCVECADFDLCGACEARQAHQQHYVLRIPQGRPQWEVAEVVGRVRALLSRPLPAAPPAPGPPPAPAIDEPEIIKEEIKEELPSDPLEEDPNVHPHESNMLEQPLLDIPLLKEEPVDHEQFLSAEEVTAPSTIESTTPGELTTTATTTLASDTARSRESTTPAELTTTATTTLASDTTRSRESTTPAELTTTATTTLASDTTRSRDINRPRKQRAPRTYIPATKKRALPSAGVTPVPVSCLCVCVTSQQRGAGAACPLHTRSPPLILRRKRKK